MAKQMSEAGQALLDDVLNIKGGAPAITWTPEQLLVIEARKELGKSQSEFAALLQIPVSTVRDWEQGRRKPGKPSIMLIKVARKHPEALIDVA